MDTNISKANRLTQALRDLMISIARSDRQVADSVGLNTSDLMCLGLIQAAKEPVTPKMLSDFAGMSTGSTTALVDRLERRGFIERKPHPTDRRGLVLALNAAAVDASGIPRLQAQFRDVLQSAVVGLTDAEVDAVLGFLARTGAGLRHIDHGAAADGQETA